MAELLNQVGQNQKIQNIRLGNPTSDALDGVTVSDLDQQARQEFKIPDNMQGALVTDVGPNSNSADAGLQQGDVIAEINHQPVTDADDAVKLCTQAKGQQHSPEGVASQR